MRHRMAGKKLGRNSSHRKAMMRNMVTSLFDHEKITTTDARAKELRKLADRLITLGKRGTLHARRQAMEVVQDKKVAAKLFERLAPRYQERPGGYTRIVKLGLREGDKASMVIIELVEEELAAKPKKTKKNTAAKKLETPAAPAPVAETPAEPAPLESSVAAEAPAAEEQAEDSKQD